MGFAKKVWALLVGIKDALVLALLLLFFAGLYGALAGRPGPAGVRQGALLLRLNGPIVEEPSEMDAIASLQGGLQGEALRPEIRERDVVRALREAVGDSRIKAVVVDVSGFSGGGLVHLQEIGAGMDAVRAAHKPVLLYGTVLEDGGVLLAAHASEAWLDPLGGAYLPGPGGYNLYFGKLLERLKISAHIFRVGTYKDYVEPYFRNDQSEAARAARTALYGAIWGELKADIHRARPKADIDLVTRDPVGWLRASGGDGAKAALAAGLVDHIGTRVEFGQHVAALAGADDATSRPGAFAHTNLATFLGDHAESSAGRAIGVVTVAGEIVDGKAGPGTAGGDRIARLIDDSAGANLAALVVRVDSPGGSVTGAEAIRAAIVRARDRGLPVVVSMANVAASGGYWVATPGARIFAEPGTITGSIGIFAVVPSFEKLLAQYGVTGDGVRTTPLSGQPDVFTGLTPEMEGMLQAEIENGYGRFVGLVADSRHKTPAQVDAIAQGRVWDGATARTIGLVDGFGGLDTALVAAAQAAHLPAGGWHAQYLASPTHAGIAQFFAAFRPGDDDDNSADNPASDGAARDWVGLVAQRQRKGLAAMVAASARMVAAGGAQAYCLECATAGGARAPTLWRSGRRSGVLAGLLANPYLALLSGAL